ncbi:MipA/OmpV family protein [Sphingomonas sp. S2-65]|uniref:MipA/OmpV family protein n=1 Tax=Sphingomonas sp. S2-65 TaxID=2903960 RepID=UPI001F1C7086|nr:MipA/OmpV family protein [Sphingomonas sp. S2-65]UYY58657.1 MipA/OmpV family protein [Sphingomonas sp. S2-65]
MPKHILLAAGAALALLAPGLACAQGQDGPREPRRIRLALGPQWVPSYPGSDELKLRPLIDVSTTRGDRPFAFEAADESAAIPLIRTSGIAIGPTFNIEGSRRREEVDAPIDEVGTTIELGGFAQAWLAPQLRAHAELRQGVNGHGGLVSNLSLDYVVRDGDRWLFSLGPRVSLSDSKYQRAYFSVDPRESAATGLPQFRPRGGVHAAGASATALYQLTDTWGLYGYVKYDRLVRDAADSPITRAYGSRDQFSGGLSLSFTFTR